MTTELLTDPGHSRADLATVRRAIREGWQIPEQLLEALPKVAGAMALKGKPREQIAAMKVLLAMKEQNDKQDTSDKVDTQRNRILELLEQRRAGNDRQSIDDGGSGIVVASGQ